MPRKRRVDKAREQLSEFEWDYLRDRHDAYSTDPFQVCQRLVLRGTAKLEALWQLHRDVILTEHIKENPGTRPALWWDHDAPRQPIGSMPGWYCDGKLPELRQRFGGVGNAVSPVNLSYGIPDVWRGIDDNDPPIFESQAAYLNRHGLFLAGEERRADFEPEAISA
jgi:hypothetical protein